MSDHADKGGPHTRQEPHGLRVLAAVANEPPSSSPETGPHGLLPDILRSVTRTAARRPVNVLWLAALLVALSVGVSIRFLEFKTDRADLIDPQADFQQRWLQYTDRFGDDADAVVVVEAADAATVRQVLEDLGRQLKEEPEFFSRVFYKFDPAALK
ncbi:MAG: hypothetical protein AB7Q45_26760, partial [Planctomycetaceae bacterium]